MTRIALNGLGRIGKLALRDLIDTGAGGQIVLINDSVGTPDQHALLMEFDSVHGRWPRTISHDADSLTLAGQRIALIYPELAGRLNGHAVRVPLLNASLTDCVFEVERATTAEEVNALFAAAAEGPLKGILGYELRELVSSDYTNDPRSSIIDAASTMVVNGTQVKIFAWYDNEWGYACRLADITRMVAGAM